MKRYLFLLPLITLLPFIAAGQKIPVNEPDYNKAALFQALPASIPVSSGKLINLLDGEPGQTVSMVLSANPLVYFEGIIVSVTSKYNNSIRSIIIQSSNYDGARFTISSTTDEKGTAIFRGRIISQRYGDTYELQYKNGFYALIKRNLTELLNE